MLKVNNLWYSYDGDHQVLKDISFELEKGGHLSVMGESGCGKSTLLKAVYGLFDIERGNLYWGKEQILGPAYHLIPGMKFFKYVSQELELMPYTTVFDNVAQYLSRIHMKRSEKRVFELLETVDMTENAHQLVKYLSGGQKQRVAIARALAREPELLLLDEPFSQIDNLHKNSLRRDLFAYLKDKNISCIVATHDSNDALSYADQLIVLKEGELVEEGDPKELYRNPSDLYVASFFDDINKILLEGEEVLCYPHELIPDTKGRIKGMVAKNYFKGAYWLVELRIADQKIYFQHQEMLSIGQEVSLSIKKT